MVKQALSYIVPFFIRCSVPFLAVIQHVLHDLQICWHTGCTLSPRQAIQCKFLLNIVGNDLTRKTAGCPGEV